jgi:hypothetical protein
MVFRVQPVRASDVRSSVCEALNGKLGQCMNICGTGELHLLFRVKHNSRNEPSTSANLHVLPSVGKGGCCCDVRRQQAPEKQ